MAAVVAAAVVSPAAAAHGDGGDADVDTSGIKLSEIHELQAQLLEQRKEVVQLERTASHERRKLQADQLRCGLRRVARCTMMPFACWHAPYTDWFSGGTPVAARCTISRGRWSPCARSWPRSEPGVPNTRCERLRAASATAPSR